MPQTIALQCTIHPASRYTRTELLTDLTAAAKSYYALPKSQCSTWSYFTPATRKGAISQNASPELNRDLTIGGIEIYTDKRALGTQQEEKWFKEYVRKSKDYNRLDLGKAGGKGEELVAWYPAAGFVSRGEGKSGKGVIAVVAKFKAKEGQADKVVENLSKYIESWVRPNEPGVLTYCVMTRPKAQDEVLLFERYQDMKAFGAHGSTKEFKGMFKSIAPHIEVKKTQIVEWEEVDGSFVGNAPGGVEDYARAASAKL